MQSPIIISLGGSIMCPDDLDTVFLRKFKTLLLKEAKKQSFIIVTGGGKTARRYIHAFRKLHPQHTEAEDWLGISATGMNAQLFKSILGDKVYKEVITDPTRKLRIKEHLAVARGFRPGYSSDMVAVMLAKTYKADTVINLSNIDYIFTKDPKHTDAKRCKHLTWGQLQKIVGTKFTPGANYPFDPKATKLAKKLDLTLHCLNGRKLAEVKRVLEGKPFKGTTVTAD